MNIILLGPPGRRQGHPGQAARGDARPGAACRPATCCAPTIAVGQRTRPRGQGGDGCRRSSSPTTSSSRMIAAAHRRAGCRQGLHPRRLPAHRAAGRGARRACWREQRAEARPRHRDEGRRGGAGRPHRRPLHLRANAAPAITTAIKQPRVAGVCDVCGDTEFVRRADDKPRDGQGPARGLSSARPRRSCPITATQGMLTTVDGMAEIDEVTRQIEARRWLKRQASAENALTGSVDLGCRQSV